jgi:ABC-type lipoprotein export system ATPase subunit
VACARALVTRPAVVFADEPTGNLDSRSGAEVLGFLRRTVDQMRQTIVMVTHDAKAASYATASCSSPTAASSTRWRLRPPSACSTA